MLEPMDRLPCFRGTITALVTPFKGGRFDPVSYARLIAYQMEQGVEAFVVLGTTGEASTVSEVEYLEILRSTSEQTKGAATILAGATLNNTAKAVRLVEKLDALEGLSGFLCATPYYNRPSQKGLFLHFKALGESTDKAIMLYSIPKRCGIAIEVETALALHETFPHINSIKEAGGQCQRVVDLKAALPDSFSILSGDDQLALPFISLGARGLVSVASNFAASQVKEMVRLALENDFQAAAKLNETWQSFFKAIFLESNPVLIKAALHKVGLIDSAEVRLPLALAEEASKARLFKVIETLRS